MGWGNWGRLPGGGGRARLDREAGTWSGAECGIDCCLYPCLLGPRLFASLVTEEGTLSTIGKRSWAVYPCQRSHFKTAVLGVSAYNPRPQTDLPISLRANCISDFMLIFFTMLFVLLASHRILLSPHWPDFPQGSAMRYVPESRLRSTVSRLISNCQPLVMHLSAA